MAILLTGVEVRHERSLRLVFSNNLAAAAFGILPTFYTVTSLDSAGSDPLVMAALAVSGSPTNTDLVLGSDLVKGGRYSIEAVGVPATDLSVTPSGNTETFFFGTTKFVSNVEPTVSNRDLILYKTDLLWNEEDFQEDANGDLARVAGVPNVTKALNRGLEANGRPWDPTWGARVREYVDSPSGAAGNMRSDIIRHCLRDPRVESVKVTFEIQGSNTVVFVDPVLVSGEQAKRVSIVVPS